VRLIDEDLNKDNARVKANDIKKQWLIPQWPAPRWVRACTTTRQGGVSAAPFQSMNLSDYVQDALSSVQENRKILTDVLDLPAQPKWLKQAHGTQIVAADSVETLAAPPPEADGSCTTNPNVVCAVLTADCLPILLCDQCGTQVAAVHAGWRGLAAGVVEAAVAALQKPAGHLLAWLGPAIGPQAFEVGNEVVRAFVELDEQARAAFQPNDNGRWMANLYLLARQRLARLGVERIYGGKWCTFSEPDRFYSYRRENKTGRMASLIWLTGKMD
jgi:YfiH family protein